MANIAVQKVSGSEKETLPVFAEINDRLEQVRRRAYELFQLRGSGFDLELDDWLTAEGQICGQAKVDLAEKGKVYEIDVTLPGFEAKDIHVMATPEEIVLHAKAEQRKSSRKEGEANVAWSEFGSSEVYRRIALPKPAAVAKMVAKFEKGALHITAPCARDAKPVASVKRAKVAAA